MKIRIHEKGIRFRLDREEVRRLSHEQNVEMTWTLGDEILGFVLGTIVDEHPICTLTGGRLSIHLPAVWLVKWDDSERTGFEFEADAGRMHIVVEKDFPCQHEPGYPPPSQMPGTQGNGGPMDARL